MLLEISDVLRFFFLNRGCQHYRGAFYMSDGSLDKNVDACRESLCESCPICTTSWHKVHLPFFKSEVIRFFESAAGRTAFPCAVDSKVPLSTVLSTRPYWVEFIFDRAARGVLVRHIDAFFFSLLAANIICMEKDRRGDLVWNLVWIDNTLTYRDDDVWDGLNLKVEGSPRRRIVTVKDK